MSNHGVVVDHIESGIRYARADVNVNPETEVYVRDLRPGESITSYIPKDKGSLVPTEDYSGREWTVENLETEIDKRNELREEDDLIVPDSTLKADLISALRFDDEATAESNTDGNSTPE